MVIFSRRELPGTAICFQSGLPPEMKSPPRRAKCQGGLGNVLVTVSGEIGLAFGFGGFFLLGLSFLFLEFEFVANELEDRHLGVVADTIAGVDDAGVAAGAIREFRSDLAEQFLRDGRKHDVGSRHTARLQRVALAKGDHFLRHRARRFGARQRGSDSPVFKQIGDQAAQHRAAMSRLLSEFGTRVEMSHRLYCSLSPYSCPSASSDAGAAVWLVSGGQMMRPCSSNFMPSARPIFTSISLISLSDLRPKFLVFSISFSLFWTSSRMVWMLAFFRQL